MTLEEAQKSDFHLVENFGLLYEEVQQSALFPDSKTFTDAVPKASTAQILEAYHSRKELPDFDLRAFVNEYFTLPGEQTTGYHSDLDKSIGQHIEDLWLFLTRQPEASGGTLIPLPYPYAVPGGRFREIYYWDSYFTMLGLQVSQRFDLVESMVNNFAYLIDRIGFIPNGNRTYYLGRSQPPFFALMVSLLAEIKGESVWQTYLPSLEKEYSFWMRGQNRVTNAAFRVVRMPDGSILNRYWDDIPLPRPEAYKEDTELARRSTDQVPEELYRHVRAAAESGWDFSSRWFKDGESMTTIHTTDIVPVDLNCLLWYLENSLQRAHRLSGNHAEANRYWDKSIRRAKAIQLYCWNEVAGFYFDFDWKSEQLKNSYTLAAAFPLFFQLTTAPQAKAVAGVLAEKFLQKNGLLTTLQSTPQQWDAPNGWAPLQWISYQGLKHYRMDDLARQIAINWTSANEAYYKKTGKMMEKYNVITDEISAQGGEYPNQDGFGWTNGVYLKMVADLK
ncbi:MAG: alpha,alpha-trehalase TreF [Spirosomataceae bacterium]